MTTPSLAHRPIRFFHQGRVVEVTGAATTRTVLDWLREDAHCTGTKEGCNEGDCGACTVVIGELAGAEAGVVDSPTGSPHIDGLSLKTVNACIQFLPTLDGKALFTVEDLKAITEDGALHPVQQAMVDCHGSQCGFCTPGFVMSLWSSYERHREEGGRPSRQQLADELSGNLCRCTGYRPILDAGQRMFDLPPVRLDTAPVVRALQDIRNEAGLHYSAQRAMPDGTRTDHFHAPRNLADLAALVADKPAAKLLAGSTDIGQWDNKLMRDVGDLIYVGDVAELKRIDTVDGTLHIGAAASLEDAWMALVARHPELQDVWLRFASLPIRNAGTLGGNIANGSPIGDGAPVLMALDAAIVLQHAAQERTLPLRDFYVDYMKSRLEPGEFVQALVVPPLAASWRLRVYKISKRFDSDISAVCAALAIDLDGDTVRAARFVYGGMAATVRHAVQAEAAVVGKPWTQDTVSAAMQALALDFTPLSDMRASAAYRRRVAANLLQRLWMETRTERPLAADRASVWQLMPHTPVRAPRAAAASGTTLGVTP
ncbi:MAG: FAD-binding molybdopterin dehydrogenase [Rhizobacter sp.]|nr:FAD-binding molybdopterin dehydrogenase [Rhizobacter sp.]